MLFGLDALLARPEALRHDPSPRLRGTSAA
jgi:hypothetical protein